MLRGGIAEQRKNNFAQHKTATQMLQKYVERFFTLMKDRIENLLFSAQKKH